MKIIFFELNEVPFRVLDAYCERFPRSCLARRILPRCRQFETHAADDGELSPWITWPTVHRGVGSARHQIRCFGQHLQEVDREFPPFWELAARHGVHTGVFGSLHSYGSLHDPQNYAFYVPDTFAAGSECFPKALAAFQEFNLAMVADSARNVSGRIHWSQAVKFLLRAPGLGLRAGTILDAAGQLLAERLAPPRRVRRRTYQTLLAFDLFYQQLRKNQPALATFFTNHVASAMHRYWAARFPEDYQTMGFDAAWRKTYGGEIDFAMHKLDRCLARLLRFVNAHPEYQLWIATSMGQAATRAEPVYTQVVIADVAKLLAACGVPPDAWSPRPAMVPDANFVLNQRWCPHFLEQIRQLTINGKPIRCFQGEQGFFSLRVLHTNLHDQPQAIRWRGSAVPPHEVGLKHLRVQDQANSNAYHIPQGMLLIYDPRSSAGNAPRGAARSKIETTAIAPAILERLEVPLPPYMAA